MCGNFLYEMVLHILPMLYRIPSETAYRVHYRIPDVYDTPCTAYIYLYEIWCNRTAFRCPRFQKAQRLDTTKFLKRHPSELLMLSNCPCLLSVLAMATRAVR